MPDFQMAATMLGHTPAALAYQGCPNNLRVIASRRARDSIGPDAIMRSITDSNLVRLFDLKTHGGIQRLISATRQNQFMQRFGTIAEEIFRLR
jgi:hypothetical protein